MSIVDTIPYEYRELSQVKAAKLAGMSRPTFVRKYWKNRRLSVVEKEDGSEIMLFETLYSEFGEVVTQNLQKILDGHTNTPDQKHEHPDQNKTEHLNKPVKIEDEQPYISQIHALQLELAKVTGEKEKLAAVIDAKNEMLEERQVTIEEQRQQIQQHLSLIEKSHHLLEDKRSKEEATPTKGFWARLLGR